MAKVELTCKSCGQKVSREEKPAPKNGREAKQVYFVCSCGAANLRDGTARYGAASQGNPGTTQGNPGAMQLEIPRETQEEPRKAVNKQPRKRSKKNDTIKPGNTQENQEETDNSGPFFF